MAKNKDINPHDDEQFEREDVYSRYSPFGYALQNPLQHQYNQQFLPQIPHPYYGSAMRSSLQMMAPPFAPSPAHAAQTSQFSDPPPPTNQDSGAQRRKNRWSDTEERILIELFGENEDKLRYKAFNSPEWQSIARQLHERCTREKVESNKSAQQCKNKMANLTKKYKAVKDKLRTTGYGKGGDEELDKETESESDLIPRHFNDMDDILGNREAVNPKHVLESSSYVESSPENDCDLLEKEALDEEILSAAQAQKERDHYQKFATFCARKSVGTRFPIFQGGDIKAEGKLVKLYFNKGSKFLTYPP